MSIEHAQQFAAEWVAAWNAHDIDAVLASVSQGAGFRQIHRAGVRLVTLQHRA